MNKAEAAANYVHQFLIRFHRGAYECEDDLIIFGNDAYSTDPRARREVEKMQTALAAFEITEFEFGVSDDGLSWAIVARTEPDLIIDPDDLDMELWACWFMACEEQKGESNEE